MYSVGNVAFRALGAGAAIILYGLTVACEREPTVAPASAPAVAGHPQVLGIARSRPVDPADRYVPTPPVVEAWTSAGVSNSLNLAYDAHEDRFLVLESARELVEMAARPDGGVDRLTTKRLEVESFGLREPRGLTVDPRTGDLFVLDGGSRIVRVEPHGLLGFRRPTVSIIDLSALGLSGLWGIALDPNTGNLHVFQPAARRLHELSPTGRHIALRDVSAFRLDNLTGMTFGPTGDATDDESAVGLYVAAGGRITELDLVEYLAAGGRSTGSGLIQFVATSAPTVTGQLIRTVQTSAYSPPSPDPSGIAYAAHLNNLVIVDGEVEEMTIYGGANAFETTLSGSLTRSWPTTSFSVEPVGAAYNPANRHLFISDDDARDVFEIDPGTDGRYGTADDRVTSFDTVIFGCNDPEGLAYDVTQGVLFIADGVNAEVYRVSPGSNGVFDGVSPAGDDQVTHFDTEELGLLDPEGIAYDSDFGHLYVVGRPATRVFHLTTAGAVIRQIDISAASGGSFGGLEYAPPSAGSGAKTLYIVDRNRDNDSDPNENDGEMYEFAVPPFSGNALPHVTITAPASGSSFLEGSAITFTGTASDPEDGNLTAGLSWTSSIDGALGSGGSVSTSDLTPGTHTITASVIDAGNAQGSAAITVNVNPEGLVEVRVAAGADDAEESATGTMSLTSSDLELVNDGSATGDQLVGVRFNGLTIAPGATIARAYVQFQVDETGSVPTSLTIRGEATDNALSFSTTRKISTRSRTTSAVSWSPVAWTVVGSAGANQQTPNLKAVIQEIVNRPGWRSGNSLVIIVSGTGRRTAEAFEDLPAGAPLLRVEYSTGPNTAPTASSVSISGTAEVGRVLTGNYIYNDAQGDAEGASTYRWLRDGTPIVGATARTYTLVAADLGALIRFEVTPAAATGTSPGTAAQSAAVGPVAEAPPNSAPTASSVTISGTAQVGQVLTGNYTYSDADGDAQGTSTYRWLRDGGTISGATARTYTLVAADQGAMIAFEVTPVAATGASPGAAAQSPAVGPVVAAGTGSILQLRIAAGADDAEESATGTMSLTSSDLELVNDGAAAGNQTVGLRFRGVAIPRGATITAAFVQFQVDEATTAATALTVRGEAADNAAAFSSTAKISPRSRTTSAVPWSPVAWSIVGQAGTGQQTPALTSIVQEIVNRPGWTNGNALAIIITGTGKRTAEAFEDLPAGAPLLHVEYSTGPNTAPTATSVGISGTAEVGRVLTGNYIYNDAQGDAEGASTYRWLRDGAPIAGATARTYPLVAADQGAMIAFEVTPVAATGTSPGTAAQSAAVGPVAEAPPNTAPTASAVTISGIAQVGQVLTGNYSYADADGDAQGASTYRWLHDGSTISGATARTYTLVAADQGAMIAFEVTPVAATGTSPGTPVQSAAVGPVAAANAAPTASNVTISGTAQVGQVLTGNYTYSDAEGDAEGTSTYRWLRSGAPISGATARTYTLVAADAGALIRFEVRPVATTGTSPGAAVQSPTVGPVEGTGTGSVLQLRIAARADDAEESAAGVVSTGSSDLELVFDGSDQLVGLRFTGVAIPTGATITGASIQFQSDRATSTATSLTIRGEATDNAGLFNGSTGKISTRTRTVSAVAWSPPAWIAAGQVGAAQLTPSLASVIQEIVNRPGWVSGNALVLIINGTGQRAAESYDGLPAGAPLLRVEFTEGAAP